jgi:simple sugar transport system permease protein
VPSRPGQPPPLDREGGRSRAAESLRGGLQSQEVIILLIGVLLFAYFAARSGHFLGYSNLSTGLAEYIAPTMIIAIAEVPILILGEIDLSVGEVYVLSPFLVHYLADAGLPIVAAIVVAIAICGVAGVINGLVTVRLRIPSFITTLGTTFAIEGIVLITAHGSQITPNGVNQTGPDSALIKVLGASNWAELIWALGLVAILHIVLRKTRFGLHNVAVGGNELAARESGIRVDRIKVTCFVMCSMIGGLVGILDGYHTGSLDPSQDGLTAMFYGVAAAVIGGTALTGGRGTIIGAAIGAIVLGVLQDGFNIVGVSAYDLDLILGLAILAAMILNVQLQAARSGGAGVFERLRRRRPGPAGGGGGAGETEP